MSKELTSAQLAGYIDHTLLKQDATIAQIEKLCEEAAKYHFASVCVNATYAALCAKLLKDTGVKVCCVVGFPLGATLSTVKAFETEQVIADGASEVDMVLNVGALKSGNFTLVKDDVSAVVRAAHAKNALVKVIIETCLLTDEEKVKACQICQSAGADFVKTSTGFSKGVEILTLGDIPAGSGLGSSSAVTVGSLHAMYVYLSRLVTTEQLAREACEIEITKLGKPIGIQDQYIAAYGGLRFIEFHQDGSVTADPVNVDPLVKRRLDENLLVFFTGVTRKADTILAEQKENIHQRLALLREMKDMAHEARTQLHAGNVDALGRLLHQSWLLKKQLASRISNGTIEDAYQAALAAGALGGKITGAGGGGFLLLYCPYERREAVRAALHSMQELPFHLEPDGTKVILNMRR